MTSDARHFHGPTRSPTSSTNSTPRPPAATPSTGAHTCADTPSPSRPAASAPQRRSLTAAGAPLPVPKSSRHPERSIPLPTPSPSGTTSAPLTTAQYVSALKRHHQALRDIGQSSRSKAIHSKPRDRMLKRILRGRRGNEVHHYRRGHRGFGPWSCGVRLR